MSADREGVHWTSTLKFVRRKPSSANLSSLGVSAPRTMPPPLKPGSPHPKLSMKTRTMLGLPDASWAHAGRTVRVMKERQKNKNRARTYEAIELLLH